MIKNRKAIMASKRKKRRDITTHGKSFFVQLMTSKNKISCAK